VSGYTRCLALVGLLAGGVAAAAPLATPPPPTSLVTDRADVLSTTVEAALTRRLTEYEASSGHQIVIWIDHSSGDASIEQFAVSAFAAWKIGQAGLDDGLAIFAMTDDRAVRIEVGYGLEPRVTDLVASTVIHKTMIPLIQRGEWDAAVVQGVESLVDTIEGQTSSLPADGKGDGDGDAPELGMWGKIGLGLLAAALLVLLVTHPRRALMLLVLLGRGGTGGGGAGGGFRGGGGRSGGGGATGRW
jgi:uncharacterized protein